MNDLEKVMKLIGSSDVKERVKFTPEYLDKVKEFFLAPMKDRITLLQSVRGENEVPQYVKDYVAKSESEGKKVYIPFHYNYQKDETGGIQICNNMRLVVEMAGTIAVAYNPASEGTKFDFGIALYHDKSVELLNPDLDLSKDLLYTYMKIKSGKQHEDPFRLMKNVESVRKTFQQECIDKTNDGEFMSLSLNYFLRDGKPPGLTLESATQFGAMYASRAAFKINPVSRLFTSDEPDAKFVKKTSIEEQLKLEESMGNMKSYSRVAYSLANIFASENK
ncbi:MAG TPA: hypothetical protein VEC16_02355 [Alphaproteobacteria bacterium]|nr:hypothetical protein [Alphaproteobacteria bacterium]